MSLKKSTYIIVSIIAVLLTGFTIWDNNRIIVVEQSILIDHLLEKLDGFTILQITDLHEKVFGEDQRRLLEKINTINYDAIIFTGDMLNDPLSTNYEPFYKLIEGISNKEVAFFVPGNKDSQSFILKEETSFEKDEFIRGMEERGVKLLDSVYKVEKGDSNLFFTYFENSIIKERLSKSEEKESKHGVEINRIQKNLTLLDKLTDSKVLIALNHYPLPDEQIDDLKNSDEYEFRNYDLIIAGHYHGGQIRLPIIGALFVPESYYFWDGLFPPQDRVKGLWEYDGIQQYVSTGLGSSDAISFLKFRFLNPPEINVLKLTKE